MVNLMKSLPRMDFLPETPKDVEGLGNQLIHLGNNLLLDEAKEVLGYQIPPTHARPRSRVRASVSDGELLRSLYELDIRPFRPEAVARYQKRQAWLKSGGLTRCAIWLVALAWVASIFFLPVCNLLLVAIGLSLWLYAIARGYVGPLADDWHDAKWRTTPLTQYDQMIPRYVLTTATRIKKAVPAAEFEIEYLKLDPFLVISIPGSLNRFYIEVWQEPKFHAARPA